MSSEIEEAINYYEQLTKYFEDKPDGSYWGKTTRDACMVAYQALREKLEREQQPSGWIKFSDRMPDTDCIVYEANSGRVLYAVHSEWEATDWNCTHWMPLPEPPKEVTK